MAATAEATIGVVTQYARQHVPLVPTRTELNPVTGDRREIAGVKIRAVDHRARISAEHLELLERHPAYTGGGNQPKTVWLETDITAPVSHPNRLEVTQGARATAATSAQEPVSGWDGLNITQLRREIARMTPEALKDALAYEATHKARFGVIEAVNQSLRKGAATVDPDPEPDAAEPPEVLVPEGVV